MTFPTDNPTWADGGGADVTDPGTAKRANGFENAEAPAAGHHNWVLKNHGDWLNSLRDSLALRSAMQTAFFSGSANGVSGGFGSYVAYCPNNAKWFVNVENGGNSDLADSADGLTWNLGQNGVGSGGLVPGNIIEVGTNVYTVHSGDIYATTTGSSTNFTATGETFANITALNRIQYDATNGLWLAAGYSSGTTEGEIESAPALGGTWTQRDTHASKDFVCLETNSVGVSVAVPDSESEFMYSSNGTSWTTDTSPTQNPYSVWWVESLGMFVFHLPGGGSQLLGFTTDGTDYYEEDFGGGFPFANIIPTDIGLFCFEQVSSDRAKVYLLSNGGHAHEPELFFIDYVEAYAASSTHFMPGNGTPGFGGLDARGGARKLVWRYDSGAHWAVASY